MPILDRYIAGAVIAGTVLALAALLPLLGFFLLADEMDQIGEREYQFVDAMLFVGLNLPHYANEIFPIATLIGALIGLGSLATRSELVAMRAAGVSIARIVLAGLKGGVVLAVIAVVLGEGIAPYALQEAQQRRTQALTGQVMQRTPTGVWARDGNAFVHIREILSGESLRDISIYELGPDETLQVATRAREARYEDGRWTLDSIAVSRISTSGVNVAQIARAEWDSLLNPRLLEVIVIDPQALPVWDLYRYVRFMTTTEQDGRSYKIALWNKLVHPLLVLTMIFVAIPILLASARTTGIGPQIVLGILVGIVFYVTSRTLVYMSLLFELSAMVAAVLPPLIITAVALWLLRRVG